jgi:hypothetical protein
VIGVGRRSVPVARWIQAQSGGRTRIVQIGRPRHRSALFDLVVTTPQYGVPAAANVLHLPLSLSRVTPERLAEAAAQWAERFEAWPRPRLALLLGGDSTPFRLRAVDALDAFRQLQRRAAERGGSVLVTASRRTPADVLRMVEEAAAASGVPAAFLGGATGNSPYLGLLALADEITVTADSASMAADAVAAGRPVGLAPVGASGPGAAWLRFARWLRRGAEGEAVGLPRPVARLLGVLARQGVILWPRDLWFLWRELVGRGLVGTVARPSAAGPPPDLAACAAARIRPLLGEPPPEERAPPAMSGRDGAPPAPAHRGGGAAA